MAKRDRAAELKGKEWQQERQSNIKRDDRDITIARETELYQERQNNSNRDVQNDIKRDRTI